MNKQGDAPFIVANAIEINGYDEMGVGISEVAMTRRGERLLDKAPGLLDRSLFHILNGFANYAEKRNLIRDLKAVLPRKLKP